MHVLGLLAGVLREITKILFVLPAILQCFINGLCEGYSMSRCFYQSNIIMILIVQGPVRYNEDGTMVYTRIRLAQWRGENG